MVEVIPSSTFKVDGFLRQQPFFHYLKQYCPPLLFIIAFSQWDQCIKEADPQFWVCHPVDKSWKIQ